MKPRRRIRVAALEHVQMQERVELGRLRMSDDAADRPAREVEADERAVARRENHRVAAAKAFSRSRSRSPSAFSRSTSACV